MRNAICLAMLAAISGCTARHFNVSLEPQMLQNGEIVYRYADVSGLGRPDDPETEQKRLSYMEEWMAASKSCPAGYTVIRRDSIKYPHQDASRIFYFIRCK